MTTISKTPPPPPPAHTEHGEHGGHAPEPPEVVGARWRYGVLLLIVADAAFVVSVAFSYFYLRGLNTDKAWVASDQKTAAIWVGWALAAGTVLSLLFYRRALAGLRADQPQRFVGMALLAVLVLAANLVGQWLQLTEFEFGANTSAYSTSLYLMAGANLFHLLLTLFLGIGIWNRGRRGLLKAAGQWQARIIGLWWTWITVAAVLGAFTTSFIASPRG
jgi:heme/copper-type cytochrome/quinol oxidase subunit 3